MSALKELVDRTIDATPAPWVGDGFSDGEDYTRLSIFSGSNQGPEIAAGICNSADAYLISAAPKMLKALWRMEKLASFLERDAPGYVTSMASGVGVAKYIREVFAEIEED